MLVRYVTCFLVWVLLQTEATKIGLMNGHVRVKFPKITTGDITNNVAVYVHVHCRPNGEVVSGEVYTPYEATPVYQQTSHGQTAATNMWSKLPFLQGKQISIGDTMELLSGLLQAKEHGEEVYVQEVDPARYRRLAARAARQQRLPQRKRMVFEQQLIE